VVGDWLAKAKADAKKKVEGKADDGDLSNTPFAHLTGGKTTTLKFGDKPKTGLGGLLAAAKKDDDKPKTALGGLLSKVKKDDDKPKTALGGLFSKDKKKTAGSADDAKNVVVGDWLAKAKADAKKKVEGKADDGDLSKTPFAHLTGGKTTDLKFGDKPKTALGGLLAAAKKDAGPKVEPCNVKSIEKACEGKEGDEMTKCSKDQETKHECDKIVKCSDRAKEVKCGHNPAGFMKDMCLDTYKEMNECPDAAGQKKRASSFIDLADAALLDLAKSFL